MRTWMEWYTIGKSKDDGRSETQGGKFGVGGRGQNVCEVQRYDKRTKMSGNTE